MNDTGCYDLNVSVVFILLAAHLNIYALYTDLYHRYVVVLIISVSEQCCRVKRISSVCVTVGSCATCDTPD